jgi:DNA-binding MarR family transcriptional regulator
VTVTLTVKRIDAVTDEKQNLTFEEMRRLLYRRDVAVYQHRVALARSLGLTDVEMLALVHLAERGEMAPSALAAILHLSSGGATALVQRLERAGHVTRHPHPTDRRSILVGLSPAIVKRLEEAYAPLEHGMQSVASALGDAERAAVVEVLTQLASLCEDLEASLRREPEPEPEALARPVPSLWA